MSTTDDLATLQQQAKARAQQRLCELEAIDQDFPLFARERLVIRPKEGGETKLVLNDAQLAVHRRAEEQLARTGRVRLIVLKARQVGISTYIEGRLYWKTSRVAGHLAYIMAHSADATSNIHDMARRFWEHDRDAPRAEKSNARELRFSGLDSGIRVATAGTPGAGRSQTIQLFHGSEAAYWPNAEHHATGILQTVPDLPGTEIWLESTANGMGGYFYNMAQAALRGENDYELVFIPWFDHADYQADPPEGWRPPEGLRDYHLNYGLSLRQIFWAWRRNAELAASGGLSSDEICWKFRQEYPATADEAFFASRTGSFIESEMVQRARQRMASDNGDGPLIVGCDFACGGDGEGGDYNVFIDRRGRRLGGTIYERFRERDTVKVANRLGRLIEQHHPDMVFMDFGGGGAAVHDILRDRGFGQYLTLINFGQRPADTRRYANKRAEMWGELRDWLGDPGRVQIPDDDVLASELTAVSARENLDQQLILTSKKEIRRDNGFSPDGGDAAALTFAGGVTTSPQPGSRDMSAGAGDARAGY